MKYILHRDVITGKYTATLLGGEFSNCHGQGSVASEALISLRIRINQLRKKQNATSQGHHRGRDDVCKNTVWYYKTITNPFTDEPLPQE